MKLLAGDDTNRRGPSTELHVRDTGEYVATRRLFKVLLGFPALPHGKTYR